LPAADWYGDGLFWFHIAGIVVSAGAALFFLIIAFVRKQLLWKPTLVATAFLLVQLCLVVFYVQRWRAARARYLQFSEIPLSSYTSGGNGAQDGYDKLTTLLLGVVPHQKMGISDQALSFKKDLTPSLQLVSSYLPEKEPEICLVKVGKGHFYCAEFLIQGEKVLFLYAELFRGPSSWDNYTNQVALRRMTSIARLYEEGGVLFVLATDVSVFSRQYSRISQQAVVGGKLSLQELASMSLRRDKLLIFSRRPHIPPDICEIPNSPAIQE
jgi:hypothetical protein